MECFGVPPGKTFQVTLHQRTSFSTRTSQGRLLVKQTQTHSAGSGGGKGEAAGEGVTLSVNPRTNAIDATPRTVSTCRSRKSNSSVNEETKINKPLHGTVHSTLASAR